MGLLSIQNADIFVILVMGFSAFATWALIPSVKKYAFKIGAIDVPKDERRMHTRPTPRLGGMAIFLSFIASVLLFCEIDLPIRGILLGSVIIVVLGVIDDIRPLKAWVKLIVQIAAALVAVYHGVRIDAFTNFNIFSANPYVGLGILSAPVTVLWIVGITNSVNLIDGLDGLAAGVSSIASLCLMVVALLTAELNLAILVAALAGACLGFLPYNKNPASIFMGDTGATFLGFVLSCISVIGLFKFYAAISFAVPLLILGLPIFDTFYAIIRRVLAGKSPMSADRSHIHHKLVDMGFSQKQTVVILYGMSGILGILAVVLTAGGEARAMILLASFAIVGVVGFYILKLGEAKHYEEQKKEIPTVEGKKDDE